MLRATSEQPIAPAMLAVLALVHEQRCKVRLVFDLLTHTPGTRVSRDLDVAIEHAHERSDATTVSGFLISVCGIE